MRAWLLLPAAALLRGPRAAAPANASSPPAATDYQLQYVGLNLKDMRPRSPFNAAADRCLTVLGGDELGGAGLGFADCAHYGGVNASGRPAAADAAPAAGTLFTLLADGRLQNQQTGWCVRRVQCLEQDVYDLGPCEAPAAGVFNLWKARSNRADEADFVGLPPQGVLGCTACGPYLLKQLCGTAETAPSCGARAGTGVAGWTKDRVHVLPPPEEERYTLAFAPAPPACGTALQQAPDLEPDLAPPWYYFHAYRGGKPV